MSISSGIESSLIFKLHEGLELRYCYLTDVSGHVVHLGAAFLLVSSQALYSHSSPTLSPRGRLGGGFEQVGASATSLGSGANLPPAA